MWFETKIFLAFFYLWVEVGTCKGQRTTSGAGSLLLPCESWGSHTKPFPWQEPWFGENPKML